MSQLRRETRRFPYQRAFKDPEKKGDLPKVTQPLGAEREPKSCISELRVVRPSGFGIRKKCVQILPVCPEETSFASLCSSYINTKKEHKHMAHPIGLFWTWNDVCHVPCTETDLTW